VAESVRTMSLGVDDLLSGAVSALLVALLTVAYTEVRESRRRTEGAAGLARLLLYEVCTEAVLTGALRERVKDDDVADLITDSLSSYSPTNDKVKKRYEVLFGHRIQNEPFWQPLTEHVARRHTVVHRGEEATSQEADDSIAAVEKTIRHLLQVQG
jgi:hypothetical protein